MNCVLLLTAVLAAYLGVSEAVTCMDIGTCTPDVSKFTGDNNNIDEACKELNKAMTCFNEALGDCRNNKNMPASAIDQIEQQMKSVNAMMEERCGSSGAGAVKVSAALVCFSVLAYFF